MHVNFEWGKCRTAAGHKKGPPGTGGPYRFKTRVFILNNEEFVLACRYPADQQGVGAVGYGIETGCAIYRGSQQVEITGIVTDNDMDHIAGRHGKSVAAGSRVVPGRQADPVVTQACCGCIGGAACDPGYGRAGLRLGKVYENEA